MTPHQYATEIGREVQRRVRAEIQVALDLPKPSFKAWPRAGLTLVQSVDGVVDAAGGWEVGSADWVDPFEHPADRARRSGTHRRKTVRVWWADTDHFSDLDDTTGCLPAQSLFHPDRPLLSHLARGPVAARLLGSFREALPGRSLYSVRGAGWDFAMRDQGSIPADYDPGYPIPLWAYVERGGLWRLGRVETIEEALCRAEDGERVGVEQEPLPVCLTARIDLWRLGGQVLDIGLEHRTLRRHYVAPVVVDDVAEEAAGIAAALTSQEGRAA
jgi:hypothetical protein